jgi:pimeloyl-ACP methyl ester carboxylesterase
MSRRAKPSCPTVTQYFAPVFVALTALSGLAPAQENAGAGILGSGIALPNPKPAVDETNWLDNAIAWTDQVHFHEWRIQRHVHSKRCRLLDGDDKTQATGTLHECQVRLNQIKREQKLAPMKGKAVVLLHGLAGPRWSMKPLAGYLKKNGGFETFNVEYASLRSSIDDQARGLANVVRNLEGVDEINLVGHSMGNIVIRRYLAGDASAEDGWKPDARVGRVVMIAPPNHGAIAAVQLAENDAFQTIFGISGQQLGKTWTDLAPRLATPREFGIISGGYGNKLGLNPLVPGDDDGRISVETTRLAGASDFLVIGAVHELIGFDPRTLRSTLSYLKSGYFVAADQKQGIPAARVAELPRTPR